MCKNLELYQNCEFKKIQELKWQKKLENTVGISNQ